MAALLYERGEIQNLVTTTAVSLVRQKLTQESQHKA